MFHLMVYVLVFGVQLIHGQEYTKLGGPYLINVNRVERCEGESGDLMDFTVLKHKMSKDTYGYNVNYTLKVPFSDDIGMIANIDISKWGMGGWGLNAYKHESKNPCGDCLKFGKKYFESFLTSSGLEVKCPIEPVRCWEEQSLYLLLLAAPNCTFGSYTAKNLQFDGKVEGLDEMPYGKYRMIIKYTRGTEVVGCWSLIAEIEEVVA